MTFLILFLLGLCVGSFINVLVDRLPRGESIGGRSYCENCRKQLWWQELIPVVSWLWVGGRCRSCRNNLSFYYPLVELLTGLLFAVGIAFALPRGLSLTLSDLFTLVYLLVIFSILTAVFFTDLKYGLIPDQLILLGVLVAAFYRIVLPTERLLRLYLQLKGEVSGLGPYLLKTDYLAVRLRYELEELVTYFLAAFALAFFFWLIVRVTKERGMGTGDITLGFLVGLVGGFPGTVVSVFLGFLFGSGASLLLIVLGRRRFGQTVPLGPFLITALLITLFFGDRLIAWYLNLL